MSERRALCTMCAVGGVLVYYARQRTAANGARCFQLPQNEDSLRRRTTRTSSAWTDNCDDDELTELNDNAAHHKKYEDPDKPATNGASDTQQPQTYRSRATSDMAIASIMATY